MDPSELYREDVYTDRKVGTIRRLTPVQADASDDTTREIVYVGETQVMTNMGALPIVFEIPAKDLKEAAEQFGPLAKQTIERTMRELQELRREQASSLVIPKGGMPPLPGGGKIQMP
ncbi:MAG: hypothetical protein IPK29_08820 [Betaproteobacteria bacterium]|nr:hypothetical protein [Betaproteobacteria bacterium]